MFFRVFGPLKSIPKHTIWQYKLDYVHKYCKMPKDKNSVRTYICVKKVSFV